MDGISQTPLAILAPLPEQVHDSVEASPWSTSGVPGIFARRVKGQIFGWVATLETPGQRFDRTFMVSTHDAQARDKAVAERQRMLDEFGVDTFTIVNARATEQATKHFGDLLNEDPAMQDQSHSLAQIAERLHALNQ